MSDGEPRFAFSEQDLEDALDDMSASGKDSGSTVPSSTDMQIDHLRRIAELSGGEALSALEFQKLPALLNREPFTTTVRIDRPLWDNSLVVLVLVGLLGFEWILRRRYDLR